MLVCLVAYTFDLASHLTFMPLAVSNFFYGFVNFTLFDLSIPFYLWGHSKLWFSFQIKFAGLMVRYLLISRRIIQICVSSIGKLHLYWDSGCLRWYYLVSHIVEDLINFTHFEKECLSGTHHNNRWQMQILIIEIFSSFSYVCCSSESASLLASLLGKICDIEAFIMY